MKFKKILLVILFTTFVFGSGAKPFGMKAGMKIDQIDKNAKKITDGIYFVSPSKKHKYFKSYKVWIHKKFGLYQLEAKGVDISSKSNGKEIKEAFKTVYNKLRSSYGKENKKVNSLKEDSFLNDSSDFLRSLKEGDRKVYVKWDINKKNKSKILLSIKSNYSYKGNLVLQYQFRNYRKVVKEKEAEKEKLKREKERKRKKKNKVNKTQKESSIF